MSFIFLLRGNFIRYFRELSVAGLYNVECYDDW
jgi:hypothetical protein